MTSEQKAGGISPEMSEQGVLLKELSELEDLSEEEKVNEREEKKRPQEENQPKKKKELH